MIAVPCGISGCPPPLARAISGPTVAAKARAQSPGRRVTSRLDRRTSMNSTTRASDATRMALNHCP